QRLANQWGWAQLRWRMLVSQDWLSQCRRKPWRRPYHHCNVWRRGRSLGFIVLLHGFQESTRVETLLTATRFDRAGIIHAKRETHTHHRGRWQPRRQAAPPP